MIPFIFIMDLDGTIIGDCSYQVMIHNTDELLKSNNHKIQNKDILSKCYEKDSKLIRPYFAYFVNKMRSYNPECQFYIYTASEASWANREIVMIEKGNNIKLNRPIFSRSDCIIDSNGMYKKSVKKILPAIQKNNKKIKITSKSILVIDNNKVFTDYLTNFILCPSYDHILFCDLWKKFKIDHLSCQFIKQYINELIETNKMCKYNDCLDIRDEVANELKYKWFFKKQRKINKNNKKFSKDMFWKQLADSIVNKQVKEFNHSTIKIII